MFEWKPETALADIAKGAAQTPAAAYAELLGRGAVARYESGAGRPTWGIFSHAEIDRAALDTESFSNVTVPAGSPRILPLMADPPEHNAYRRLVNPYFVPAAIGRIEEEMRPIATGIIDAMIEGGDADFAQTYAYPFATWTLCRFLRVKEDWRIYNDWSSEMERLTGSGTVTPGSTLPMEHLSQVVPYIHGLVVDRRAHPGDDIVSGIIQGEIDGKPLSDQDVIGLVIALILAGRSTTASGIGNIVLRLAYDLELQEYLRANPDRIRAAVEESLRIESPQQQMPRMATRDIEVDGALIKAGDSVFLNYGSANLDPARWEHPERFDLDRKSRQHFAFGRGVHQCFGAPLGRMQIRMTLEELLRRTRVITLAGEVRRNVWPRLSVEHLPVRFTPA